MSEFSGKCDFRDDIEIFGLEKVLNGEVYIGDSDEPLKLTCYKDCIPYFPYIAHSVVSDSSTLRIRLSKRSYVDIQEEEFKQYGIESKMIPVYRSLLQEELGELPTTLKGRGFC